MNRQLLFPLRGAQVRFPNGSSPSLPTVYRFRFRTRRFTGVPVRNIARGLANNLQRFIDIRPSGAKVSNTRSQRETDRAGSHSKDTRVRLAGPQA